MRCFLRTTAIWAGLAALAGAATVGFGLFNVSARIGHLPPVHWALHTTFEQNVRLRAPSEAEVPANLGDPGLAAIGAGHYDSACRFCHASPGEAQSATALSMNPAPPHVSDAAASWEPNQLHWIVDNGVKMSGMPHWPTETRDDDVWAVVAFLDAVPDMGNDDYEAMAECGRGRTHSDGAGAGLLRDLSWCGWARRGQSAHAAARYPERGLSPFGAGNLPRGHAGKRDHASRGAGGG